MKTMSDRVLGVFVRFAFTIGLTFPLQCAQAHNQAPEANPATTSATSNPAAQQTPAQSEPQTPAAAGPRVDSVILFPQAVQPGAAGPQSSFVLQINGAGFATLNMDAVRVLVLPSAGVGAMKVVARSSDNSSILAQFTAPANYALEQVALSLSDTSFATFNTGAASCDFQHKVVLTPQIVSAPQTKTKYGNGVAANFYVIQVSIVNECPMAIVVPLAGMRIVPEGTEPAQCGVSGNATLVPFSLDHVTSIYSADRKLTGARAIYFNSLLAAASIGSAIEPFFARGFTQAVAILGGGFTTASKEIFVDMSADQLQNITSQSFGSAEQISSSGSLQKFVFIPKKKECKDGVLESNLRSGNFSVKFELTPAAAQAPSTQVAKASPSAAAK